MAASSTSGSRASDTSKPEIVSVWHADEGLDDRSLNDLVLPSSLFQRGPEEGTQKGGRIQPVMSLQGNPAITVSGMSLLALNY